MMQTLQNLSTEGLPITLTEFGVKPPNAPGAGGGSMSTAAATEQSAASILSDSLRHGVRHAQRDRLYDVGLSGRGKRHDVRHESVPIGISSIP